VWAREKITILEYRIEDIRKYFGDRLDEMLGKTETPVKIRVAYDTDRYAPVDSRIQFTLENGDEIQFYFNENRDGIKVFKEGRLPATGAISVKPECSNVVEVR
jgi:hypothetical protein